MKISPAIDRNNRQPTNHIKPWMLADFRDLDAMYGNGDTYKTIGITLGRTKGSI